MAEIQITLVVKIDETKIKISVDQLILRITDRISDGLNYMEGTTITSVHVAPAI